MRTAAEHLHAELSACVRDYGVGDWEVLAASPCVLAKLRNVYRWHIVVKAPQDADMSKVFLPLFRSRKASAEFSVAVDVDPLDLL